jgi:Ras-related protein Rab-1A
MVYDVTHRESFDHVSDWLGEVNKHASEDCCKLIIGNKSDAPGRAVTTEEAREKADELACPFLETSAKSALNVEEAFLTLASELLRRAPPEKPQKKRLSLAASAKEKGKKCCS